MVPLPVRRHALALARLIAQRRQSWAAACERLRSVARAEAQQLDHLELDAEVVDALAHAVRWWNIERDRTRFAIRRALIPEFAQCVPSARLLIVARAVNESRRSALADDEVLQVLRVQVHQALRNVQAAAR